jgi:predicted transcriptional regulator
MLKLSNADRNRILARSLFVDADKSMKQISDTLGVSEKTISNYQSKDKKEGYDWLTLKASKHIVASQEKKENMYSMFVGYMYDSLKEIRENEDLTAEEKASLIVSLGDSFSKMRKVASSEDPEAYKLGIIKHTVRTILESLKNSVSKECMEQIVNTVYQIQEELGNIDV